MTVPEHNYFAYHILLKLQLLRLLIHSKESRKYFYILLLNLQLPHIVERRPRLSRAHL